MTMTTTEAVTALADPPPGLETVAAPKVGRGLDLPGIQKAAVMLVLLGRERAAKVIQHLDGPELDELVAQVVRLHNVPTPIASDVLTEFHAMAVLNGVVASGGESYARQMLEQSLGKELAAKVMGRIAQAGAERPLKFLHDVDAQQLISILRGEHPQTLAAVVAHLRPEQASLVMSGLSAGEQTEVATRLATTGRFQQHALLALQDVLMGRTSSVMTTAGNDAVSGGVQALVDILNRSDSATERQILEGLDSADKELADEVRGRLFTFSDIIGLEDRAVQMVLRQVEAGDLATALKGVPLAVSEKVLGNVSERARENLLEEIELLGAVRLSAVEEARAGIVQVIRALEESGQLVVRRGGDGDEYVS